MSKPRGKAHPDSAHRSPRRNTELCKTVFAAAVSQILYARCAFEARFFRVVPLKNLASKSLEDIIKSGSPSLCRDLELLKDTEGTIFLHKDDDYDLTRFLGVFAGDILPSIEKGELIKFRLFVLRSATWNRNCLIEYYTMIFEYHQDGSQGIDIWRRGAGSQHISATAHQLRDLGDYLNRLPRLHDQVYFTLGFSSSRSDDDDLLGIWKFDNTAVVRAAGHNLHHQSRVCRQKLVHLDIEPLPCNISDPRSISSRDVKPTPQVTPPERNLLPKEKPEVTEDTCVVSAPWGASNSFVDSLPDIQTNLPESPSNMTMQPKTKDEATLEPNVKEVKGTKAASSGGLDNSFCRLNTTPPTMENLKANTVTSQIFEDPASSQAPTQERRRKPKPPLQIFEISASSQAPTQEVLLDNQTKALKLRGNKRHLHNTAVNNAPKAKRLKSPTPLFRSSEPSMSVDYISASSEYSSSDGSYVQPASRDSQSAPGENENKVLTTDNVNPPDRKSASGDSLRRPQTTLTESQEFMFQGLFSSDVDNRDDDTIDSANVLDRKSASCDSIQRPQRTLTSSAEKLLFPLIQSSEADYGVISDNRRGGIADKTNPLDGKSASNTSQRSLASHENFMFPRILTSDAGDRAASEAQQLPRSVASSENFMFPKIVTSEIGDGATSEVKGI
ncbi:hypothetical protein B0H63DRAFT_523608 [Podospora didyma]|uniref:HORMA domain-containing protein n=1 Tax=Podospora didyma TaxID=330526 RepID=A0AAE0NG10_9PEZI|nr:hypothetical protein B0H63DRAFT_523608 [Podospora didyma]